MGVNTLTGEYIDIGVTGRRPVAVVIDNIRRALPQTGIAQADILYEVLAEGGTTRLVAIFKEFDAEKIGPVRSARSYFVDIVLDHDAIFVHHGGSPASYNDIQNLNINNLDGITEGQVFWRDQARLNQGRRDHSSFTNTERIWHRVHQRGMRYAINSDHPHAFAFYPGPSEPRQSEPATEIEIPFVPTYSSWFTFDEETGLYTMSTTHGPHIDEDTGDALTFSNIIVQNTQIRQIGDYANRRDVVMVGQGGGYLFTNGRVAPITWVRDDRTSSTRWYNEQGLQLNLNRGRTYIAITQNAPIVHEPSVEYDEDEDENDEV